MNERDAVEKWRGKRKEKGGKKSADRERVTNRARKFTCTVISMSTVSSLSKLPRVYFSYTRTVTCTINR